MVDKEEHRDLTYEFQQSHNHKLRNIPMEKQHGTGNVLLDRGDMVLGTVTHIYLTCNPLPTMTTISQRPCINISEEYWAFAIIGQIYTTGFK